MQQFRRIKLFGIVQGVGFRPFTHLAADSNNIKGTVANKGSYVEIFAKGEEDDMERFLKALSEETPDRANVLKIRMKECEPFEAEDFKIIESEKEYGDIFVSPDIATCDKCRKELFDKTNRRYLHPFINCTQCGPRVTILDSMPYDRERTSMKKFPMCPECEAEYTSPLSRRYDAQPVCCNKCGPEVYIIGTDLRGGAAITEARRAIMDGKIVAVKGIGGFHLACDARNDAAVARLRELKHRPMKPLAVMMRDIETAERECVIDTEKREMLTGWQKPIILLDKKTELESGLGQELIRPLSTLLAPDNPTVGVMLPYAPVQMLLFDYPDEIEMTDALVMTSGNVSGAPISRCDEDALNEISSFTDLMLSHNRDIRLRADDSVMDYICGRPYMIRRSRGFAPLPVMISNSTDKQILAIGGELKNTFCIAKGDLLYLSPYVGDMGDIRTVNALTEAVTRMTELLEAEPEVIVADLHPKYNTGAVAEQIATERNIPIVRIQHHYAHILSCMAENDFDGKVIGLSYDGTGFGEDGTIWGGEILICDRSGYERAGSIEPFMQVGGDISAKEGWRIAVQLIRNAYGDEGEAVATRLGICTSQEYKLSCKMADAGINSVKSTSCGRLFDGVSAILGIRRASTFEGEASIALMHRAMKFEESERTQDRIAVQGETSEQAADKLETQGTGQSILLETSQLVRCMVEGVESGEPVEKLAYLFHKGLADQSVEAVKTLSEKTGIRIAALSGGVFQNTLLVRLVKEGLEKEGITVLLHSEVPPNDGGIALGQAYYKSV